MGKVNLTRRQLRMEGFDGHALVNVLIKRVRLVSRSTRMTRTSTRIVLIVCAVSEYHEQYSFELFIQRITRGFSPEYSMQYSVLFLMKHSIEHLCTSMEIDKEREERCFKHGKTIQLCYGQRERSSNDLFSFNGSSRSLDYAWSGGWRIKSRLVHFRLSIF